MNPLIIGGVLEIGKSIITRLFPDPEQRAKAELELLSMQQKGELQELETRMSAIVMEAQSPDPWTSRARPSFMYVFYILLLASLPMGVLFAVSPDTATAVTKGFKDWLAAVPDSMWDLFLFGYLGYSGARTYEKRHGVTK